MNVSCRIALLFHQKKHFVQKNGMGIYVENPLSGWRSMIVNFSLYFIRIGLFISGFYYVNIKNKRDTKETAPIIVSNHCSIFESLFLIYYHGCSPVMIEMDNFII